MNKEIRNSLKSYLIELAVYSVLVVLYVFLVLNLMGSWLFLLYEYDLRIYAVVAVCLIVAQGIGLEILTRVLLKFIQPRTEDE